MSQADVWTVVGRAKADATFAAALFRDFDGTLRENGFTLTPDEAQAVRRSLSGGGPSPDQQAFRMEDVQKAVRAQQEEVMRRVNAQTNRAIDLNDFTAKLFKETIQHSAATYRKITLMNQVMFWMGVVLFAGAAFCAVFLRNLDTSKIFAGLGVVSFIGFFLLGPIQKTQTALSNLIQAQIVFMSYYEQIYLIEGFATMPRDNSTNLPDPARLDRASEILEQRCGYMVALLQNHLEDPVKTSREGRKKAKRPSGRKTQARDAGEDPVAS